MFFESNLGGGGEQKVYFSGVVATKKNTHIDCGFKPKYIMWTRLNSNKPDVTFIYDENYSTTQYRLGSSQNALAARNIQSSDYLASVDDTGFTFGNHASLTSNNMFLVVG